MFSDGPKRQGRFLKSGSKVLEHVAVQDFSFAEINNTTCVTHDNDSGTIIHHKYHHPDSIEAGVRAPDRFDADLQSEATRRPVLIPLDFTRDWERDKRLKKDRIARSEDDEDVDFDYEAAMRAARMKQAEEEEEEDRAALKAAGVAMADQTPAEVDAEAEAEAADEEPAAGFRFQKPQAQTKADVNSAADMIRGAMLGQEEAPEAFVPMTGRPQASQGEESQNAVAAEALAAEEYKRRLAQREQEEREHAQAIEEAKARGYREGFRVGEEKGELAARQNAAAVFSKVKELIAELGELRAAVLENVQENFYEICQGMAEALLRREFTIHPDTFAAVLRRAIEEAVEPGALKIKVHPEMYDRLMSLDVPDLKDALVKDGELDPADFRVESDLSVVDVNLSKLIQDLLQQADLSIIEREEKAG